MAKLVQRTRKRGIKHEVKTKEKKLKERTMGREDKIKRWGEPDLKGDGVKI